MREKKFPILKTQRLILDRFIESDKEPLYKMRIHPEVLKWLFHSEPESFEKVKEIFRKVEETWKRGSGINWAVRLKGDEKLAGYVGFHKIVREHNQAEIGYMMHPDHWGKGLMQEAVKVAMDHGFAELALHRIEAYVNAENIASIHLLEKFGFKKEGHFRDFIKEKKGYQDALVYSLLDSD